MAGLECVSADLLAEFSVVGRYESLLSVVLQIVNTGPLRTPRLFIDVIQEIDLAEVWFGVCHVLEEAKSYCQTFLQSYFENSEELRPCMGPGEYKWERTVTSAASVLGVWRSLIGMADSTVLKEGGR